MGCVGEARLIFLVLAAALMAACDCGSGSGKHGDDAQDGGADGGGDLDGGNDGGGDDDDAGGGDDAGDDGGVLTCTSCHGSDGEPAPPVDTSDEWDTSLATVGAHREHLGSSRRYRTGECTDCHVVPIEIDDPGHIDDPPAELVWGDVSTADGVVPEYAERLCTVYCHGVTLRGGEHTVPDWTRLDGMEAYCGTCHSIPPPMPHPDLGVEDCSGCHPFDGLLPENPERHVDGTVDVTVGCTSCHGGDDGPAPPMDTHGNMDTDARGVGAHQSHLAESDWHRRVVCTDCHHVPGRVDDPAHRDGDGIAELTWEDGSLAKSDGAEPDWDGTTCSGVYCHGPTLAGGRLTTPTWSRVGVGEAACGTCHGIPPGGRHPARDDCSTCHGEVIDARSDFVAPELHIDGIVQVDEAAACGACHDLPPDTGAHRKHAGLAEPVYGALGTAADLVAPAGYAFGCGFCHPLDDAGHMDGGFADVELYDADAPPGSLKFLNPDTAEYVPGDDVAVDAFGVEYTEGTCFDVYCHSGMVTSSEDVPEPGIDFPFVGYPIVYPPYAVTRVREYRPASWGDVLDCGGCHGYPPRGEDPDDVAGAGESHAYLAPDGWEDLHIWNHGWDPVACRTCHDDTVSDTASFARDAADVTALDDVPIAGYDVHVDGAMDVAFDTGNPISYLGPIDLGAATYDEATGTCSDVECHLEQTSVVFGAPYRTTNAAECNSCHRM